MEIYNHKITLVMLLAGVMSFGSCTTENLSELSKTEADPALTLEIVRSGEATRASGSEFTAAEKVVSSIDLFLFKEQNDDAQVVYYTRVTADMYQPNGNEDRSNEGKIKATIPLNGIFYDEAGEELVSNTCYAYAAVNTDVTQDLNWQDLTLGKLKDIKASSEWFVSHMLKSESGTLKLTDAVSGQADGDFDGFVMFSSNDNGDVITYNETENKITGKIHVDKLASKIDLFIGFGSEGGTYGSNFSITGSAPNDSKTEIKKWFVYNDSDDAIEAFIVNGVKSVRLGGYDVNNTSTEFLSPDDYFDLWYEDDGNTTEGNEGDDGSSANARTPLLNYAHGFNERVAGQGDDSNIYPYAIEAPFYTYSSEWGTDVLEQHRTYLILKVNWIPEDGNGNPDTTAALLETYYKIPFNVAGESANKILANHYYRVRAKINTLGGRHFGEPVILDDCSVEILPWGETPLKAHLRETRYLEIRQEVYDNDGTPYTAIMNNVKTVKIPFYSSHKVQIKEASITYYTYTAATADGKTAELQQISNTRNFELPKESVEDDDYTYTGAYINNINNYIIIQHDFHPVNSPNGNGPYTHTETNTYSPYDIHIVLEHTDDSDIFDEINVRQYPAMFADVELNPGESSIELTGNWFADIFRIIAAWVGRTDYGYTYVNKAQRNSDFGGVNGIAGGWLNGLIQGAFSYTSNPVMYTISATALSDEAVDEFGFPLHIGDPRVNYVDNELTSDHVRIANNAINDLYMYEDLPLKPSDQTTESSWAESADVWNNGNVTGSRKLLYYYPTDETHVDECMYMVAPKYKVSSSYGTARNPIDRREARRRCASYQENGYPAGRWRLPTLGELIYINRMSNLKIIPRLFSTSQSYWSANGLYKITGNDADNTKVEEDLSRDIGQTEVRGYVRCVYDEWYWVKSDGEQDIVEDDRKTNTFFWGDKHKNNPQKQPNQ